MIVFCIIYGLIVFGYCLIEYIDFTVDSETVEKLVKENKFSIFHKIFIFVAIYICYCIVLPIWVGIYLAESINEMKNNMDNERS